MGGNLGQERTLTAELIPATSFLAMIIRVVIRLGGAYVLVVSLHREAGAASRANERGLFVAHVTLSVKLWCSCILFMLLCRIRPGRNSAGWRRWRRLAPTLPPPRSNFQLIQGPVRILISFCNSFLCFRRFARIFW